MRAPCAGSRSSSADWVTSTGAPASASMNASRSGRIAGIERQIGAARLEDADEPDDHLGRALDAQPDHDLGTDAERAQMMRQPVGARIELAHSSGSASPNTTAIASGVRADLRGEQLRQGGGRNRTRGVVPRRAGWCRARRAPGCPGCRSPARARQPPPPAAGRADPPAPRRWRDRTGRWRIPPPRRSPPARRPRRAARPGSPTGRTSRSRSQPARSRASAQRSSSCTARGVLQRQHHLEQRMARQRARRVEHLHQPLERQVLVAVGRQIARPHPRRPAPGSSDCPTCRCAAPAC